MKNSESILLVVTGPSGAGKGTVLAKVMDELEGLEFSVSVTTRKARYNEVEAINYFFIDKDKFDDMVKQDAFIEYANVYGNYYGTPRAYVQERMSKGRDVLLEIDVQGAMMVMDSYKDAIFIFIAPPSIDELRQRLVGRGTEDEDSLRRRLGKAEYEMSLTDKFDYVVVNDIVDRASQEIISIVEKEKENRRNK